MTDPVDSFVPRRASGRAPASVRGWVLKDRSGRAPDEGVLGPAFRALAAAARGRAVGERELPFGD